MTVPLSEREEQILREIEKRLQEEDPALAHDVGRERPRPGRLRAGVALLVSGLAALIAFFVVGWAILAVAAYTAMVAGIVLIAGSLPSLFGGESRPKEQLANLFQRWEERVRDRYRKE